MGLLNRFIKKTAKSTLPYVPHRNKLKSCALGNLMSVYLLRLMVMFVQCVSSLRGNTLLKMMLQNCRYALLADALICVTLLSETFQWMPLSAEKKILYCLRPVFPKSLKIIK